METADLYKPNFFLWLIPGSNHLKWLTVLHAVLYRSSISYLFQLVQEVEHPVSFTGTGRGEEGDRHKPANWPFLRLAPSAGSDCLEWTHSDSHAPEWGSLLMMMNIKTPTMYLPFCPLFPQNAVILACRRR